MEEPKNLKPGKKRVSDVIDSIGESLPYTNDHRVVSSPEQAIGSQGPDPPVSLGYDSGTSKPSVTPDSYANPSSPKKLLKMLQVDVTDASPMSQDNDTSPR
jgi:hypothetical protein